MQAGRTAGMRRGRQRGHRHWHLDLLACSAVCLGTYWGSSSFVSGLTPGATRGSWTSPRPQVLQGAQNSATVQTAAMQLQPEVRTTFVPWLLAGCALFLGARTARKSRAPVRRPGIQVMVLGATDRQFTAAHGICAKAPQCPLMTDLPYASSAAAPTSLGSPPALTGAYAPSSGEAQTPAELAVHAPCLAGTFTPRAPRALPKPALLAGNSRHASPRRPRCAPTGPTRAERRSIGARVQPAVEPPMTKLSYDPSRLRTVLQVGLRAENQRRCARPREFKAPSVGSGLNDQSGGWHIAYFGTLAYYADNQPTL